LEKLSPNAFSFENILTSKLVLILACERHIYVYFVHSIQVEEFITKITEETQIRKF